KKKTVAVNKFEKNIRSELRERVGQWRRLLIEAPINWMMTRSRRDELRGPSCNDTAKCSPGGACGK
ncbi:hypothetical protein BgiBS90_036807, partial [Biomphalaria glabrata]